MNAFLIAIFVSVTPIDSIDTVSGSVYNISNTVDNADSSIIDKLYKIGNDTSGIVNKDHLLKNDPHTSKELYYNDLEKTGKKNEKWNQDNAKSKRHR